MTPGQPTDFELEILQELWGKGPQTVRQVHDTLTKRRPIVYTTVLKALQVMHEKGLVTRDDSQRSHVYQAAVEEKKAKLGIVNQIIDHVFGGSAAGLAMHALKARPSSSEEIKKIQVLLTEMEGTEAPPAAPQEAPRKGKRGNPPA